MNELVILFMIFTVSQMLEVAVGFGGTLFAVAIGSIFYPVPELLMFLVPLNLLLNVFLMLRERYFVDYKLILFRILPLMAVGYISTLLLPEASWQLHMSFMIGLGLILLGLNALYSKYIKTNHVFRLDWRDTVLLIIGGIAHAFIGAGGPFVSYQLTNRPGVEMRKVRATLAFLWFVMNGVLLFNLWRAGTSTRLLDYNLIGASLVVIPLSYIFGQAIFTFLERKSISAVVGNILLVFSGLKLMMG